jgi:hypothetical protein
VRRHLHSITYPYFQWLLVRHNEKTQIRAGNEYEHEDEDEDEDNEMMIQFPSWLRFNEQIRQEGFA